MFGNVKLLLNNRERFNVPMVYCTRVYPKIYFKKYPKLDRIGVLSFALNSLNYDPSGSYNFSKLSNKELELEIANNDSSLISDKLLKIYAVNYNILLIKDNRAGLLFN